MKRWQTKQPKSIFLNFFLNRFLNRYIDWQADLLSKVVSTIQNIKSKLPIWIKTKRSISLVQKYSQQVCSYCSVSVILNNLNQFCNITKPLHKKDTLNIYNHFFNRRQIHQLLGVRIEQTDAQSLRQQRKPASMQ